MPISKNDILNFCNQVEVNLPARKPNNKQVIYGFEGSGKYHITESIMGFTHDAINIFGSGICLLFKDKTKISSDTKHTKSHRDAIQLYPGKGILAYSYWMSDVTIVNATIKSTDMMSQLQGITGFDGVFLNVTIVDVDIDIQHPTGIQFNGLCSGLFRNISIKALGNRNITLLPARLCGGNKSIWLAEPFFINDKKVTYEEITGLHDLDNINVIDYRKAFSQITGNGDLGFPIKMKKGERVYSHINIGELSQLISPKKQKYFNQKGKMGEGFDFIRNYVANNATLEYEET